MYKLMNYLKYIIVFFCANTMLAQTYKAESIGSFKNVIEQIRDSTSTATYTITENELDQLIKESPPSLHLVYVFASWCSPCMEKLPKIIKIAESNKIPLYIIMQEENDSKRLYRANKVLSEKINIPSYVYDFDNINSGRFRKRTQSFQKFIQHYLKEEYDPGFTYGFTNFFLLDKNADLIFSNKKVSHQLDNLVKIIKNHKNQS